MPFTSEERRGANYIGQLGRDPKKAGVWTGHLTDRLGSTILLTGQIEDGKLVLLANYGFTADQKRLRRGSDRKASF